MTQSDSLHRRRVLFVSYLFPPVGGVGVHRVTKFVKYLPQFGWDCSVLTVANPSTPLLDGSLRRDIPVSTVICRAKTLEPGYAVKAAVGAGKSTSPGGMKSLMKGVKRLARQTANTVLQPDPQILWRPGALREGKRLLKETPHDAIIATGPPFSSLLLGASLARHSGLPLILDYRDEWGISNAYWENKQHSRLSNLIQKRMQFSAVRAASVLLATSPSSANELEKTSLEAGSSARARFIYNGYDPDDFQSMISSDGRVDYGHGVDRCRIAFVGTLWNLNPIGPVVNGLLRFASENPELAGHLELVFAGRRTPEQEAELERLNDTPVKVVQLPFTPHDEAIRLMQDADGLLLINADKPETHRIINAKTFEYMAARRPIFLVAPKGDLWDLTSGLPGTVQIVPGESEAMARGFAHVVERHQAGIRFDARVWDISRFERRHLASELSELLNDTLMRKQVFKEATQSQADLPEIKSHPLTDSHFEVDALVPSHEVHS